MAIRNDFAPGEVLAAADLNDTFGSKLDYPAGGSDGDLLAKDGTDAEWVAPEPPGLELITSESFSAVSSVSLNGCFTSTYLNYKIMLRASMSTAAALQFRMRQSSSDDTGSVYIFQHVVGQSSTASASTGTGTSGFFNSGNNATFFACASELFDPQIEANTVCQSTFRGSAPSNGAIGTIVNTTTTYDGISISASTGNMTGAIRVYGYRN
jgi:hypothetical protein